MNRKKLNGGEHKAFADASIEFYCEDDERGVNLVSATGLKYLPRVGETVILPGPNKDSKPSPYEVVSVNYNFRPETAGELPSEARLLSVNISVKRSK